MCFSISIEAVSTLGSAESSPVQTGFTYYVTLREVFRFCVSVEAKIPQSKNTPVRVPRQNFHETSLKCDELTETTFYDKSHQQNVLQV